MEKIAMRFSSRGEEEIEEEVIDQKGYRSAQCCQHLDGRCKYPSTYAGRTIPMTHALSAPSMICSVKGKVWVVPSRRKAMRPQVMRETTTPKPRRKMRHIR